MPILADQFPRTSATLPLFFSSLAELDQYTIKPKFVNNLEGVLPFSPRNSNTQAKGKLLVCHDYKGGYTEGPASLSYTYNFWDICDTFIYFSHQRVTIPPPSWINAAHRQGVKMLGVLIFEHEQSVEENLRLLLGKTPSARTGRVTQMRAGSLPVSSYYARVLADLARERGFDGYLLNFEYKLPGNAEQARALEAWVGILRQELKSKIGDHAQAMWYDSIVVTGALAWQDRLNSRNLPFFLASDTFFTNYTWPNIYPSMTAQYFLNLDPSIFHGTEKSLQDIFVGVDVWPGRNCHGDGGFGAYKALEHVDPEFMGLSAAVFGPAWTWESEEDKDGWDWNKWWSYERRLWLGPEIEGEKVAVSTTRQRQGEPVCTHGDFKPLGSFFSSLPPPNPSILPFFSSFCPGVGFSWFIQGKEVLHKDSGWTDADKQTSLGDQLWPRPRVQWEGTVLEEPLPSASTSLTFTDAFNSGSSAIVRLSGKNTSAESFFRCFWVPVQSLSISPGTEYEAELIYKASYGGGEIDIGFSAKLEGKEMEISPVADGSSDNFVNGWGKATIRFTATSKEDSPVHVGIVIGAAPEDPSLPYDINIHLGQLSVYPCKPPGVVRNEPRILWVDSQSDPTLSNIKNITWDTCLHLTTDPTLTNADIVPDNPRPAWQLDRSQQRFLYFNIYLQPQSSNSGAFPNGDARFVGTTGHDGLRNSFAIDRSLLPDELKGPFRVYVQGVTDCGKVMPWEHCAFVDSD